MIKANGSGLSQKAVKWMEIMKERRLHEVSLADKYLEIIKGRTPVGKSTSWGEQVVPAGATRKSWTIHILQNDANGVRWTINADGREDIVFMLEYGTKAHGPILPKKPGGILAFEIDGEMVFTSRVKWHPGTKPLHIVKITQQEINEEAKRLELEMHAKIRAVNH